MASAMKQSTMAHVGMDTHKDTILVALAAVGRRGEVRFIDQIPGWPEATAKMVDRLTTQTGVNSSERNSKAWVTTSRRLVLTLIDGPYRSQRQRDHRACRGIVICG
jgi:hypothetical protein